ncbi:MAG: hypothetical protein F6K31_00970 [Symploca sp. SIO2G7]|nr:hypothetical protein [Symploca sp. SIO2G7]
MLFVICHLSLVICHWSFVIGHLLFVVCCLLFVLIQFEPNIAVLESVRYISYSPFPIPFAENGEQSEAKNQELCTSSK